MQMRRGRAAPNPLSDIPPDRPNPLRTAETSAPTRATNACFLIDILFKIHFVEVCKLAVIHVTLYCVE
jgi:hypothetical protein